MAETIRLLAFGLAEAFLRGPWTANALADRACQVLLPQTDRAWIASLSRRIIAKFPGPTRPVAASLIHFIERNRSFLYYCQDQTNLRHLCFDFDLSQLPQLTMQPSAGAASNWPLPPLVSLDDVAEWLGIGVNELEWFADCRGQEAKLPEGPLRQYRYRWIAKSSGGYRLLEVPKQRLKRIQRKILDEILNAIPPHTAAHAFRPGRSVSTLVAPHVNQRIVISMDLREFFPSVRASQVHALFRAAGYPERVASILTGLCTNVTPQTTLLKCEGDFSSNQRWMRYKIPHLPQGAPTSPALANLAAFWLDCRLSGLARKVNANYTRYADDLVFSGGPVLSRCSSRFRVLIAAIAHNEGFEIRRRKTREMRSGSCQRVAGITLNRHANIPRQEYDTLRATLHNCRRHGPSSQNRNGHERFREHLLGRIAYWSTICAARAKKLHEIFDDIAWDENRSMLDESNSNVQ